ncbi:hypothetical protein [Pseudomonas sp. UMAB-08]|nr:hypothetical protein [Pseudomonas sp. UMAB-08]
MKSGVALGMLLAIALFYLAREHHDHMRPGDALIGVGGIQRFTPAPGFD